MGALGSGDWRLPSVQEGWIRSIGYGALAAVAATQPLLSPCTFHVWRQPLVLLGINPQEPSEQQRGLSCQWDGACSVFPPAPCPVRDHPGFAVSLEEPEAVLFKID